MENNIPEQERLGIHSEAIQQSNGNRQQISLKNWVCRTCQNDPAQQKKRKPGRKSKKEKEREEKEKEAQLKKQLAQYKKDMKKNQMTAEADQKVISAIIVDFVAKESKSNKMLDRLI